MERRTISLADQVFERLEREILTGVYQQGEFTTELKLCGALGVSRTPVREALKRLEQENLVQETGKGIMIVGITPKDLVDIMEVRLRLESLAAERAAERITDEELARLKETLELQSFYLEKNNPEKLKTMDSEFHTILYEASGSFVLFNILSPIHHKVQRYRRAALEKYSRATESTKEHWAIFRALEEHDPEKASEAMKLHTEHVKENLLKEYATWGTASQKKS